MAVKRFRKSRMLGRPSLFGLESECQGTLFARDGDTLSRKDCFGHLVRDASRHAVSLPGRDEFDLYLANGGRFYRDDGCGLINLEYATPECTTPDELIAHARAGDAIVAAAVDNYVARHDHIESGIVSKCNFDYHGHTSGSHENHLHTQLPQHLAPQLVPLLASRSIVSGGGGFDDTSPGLDFMCSPRVNYLEYVVSRGAQDSRAIFTIKDESLAGPGYERLQLLSSESVRCETSERLRFAPVALVLRMTAADVRPGDAMRLADPLAAINTFARDPGGTATAKLAGGGRVTALDVQRHYLSEVESCLSESWMPEWAETECARWRWVLDALTENPQRLIGHLDWPTKRHLYRTHCEHRGVPWETLPRWGSALRELLPGIHAVDCSDSLGMARHTPCIEHLLKQRGGERRRTALTLDRHDLSMSDLPRFVALRNELFEIDIRFGDIGPDSLFATLERDGAIAAGAVGTEAVARAMTMPPSGTRAALRASWIRHLHPERAGHTCDWAGIRNMASDWQLDLSDPFGNGLAVPPITGTDDVRRAATEPHRATTLHTEVAR
jgi:proteasome accessory factor A